jgi:hypothetical protein
MAHSYVAYIDESGDDGLGRPFRQIGKNGSSHWLILSACVFRQIHDLDAVSWRDEIGAKMPERQSRELHFKKLSDGQKLAAVQTIATKPLRTLSVVAAKTPIPADVYVETNQLYWYMARYLVERVSWLCRDARKDTKGGDGRVKITFSRRGNLQSYEEFRQYLRILKSNAQSNQIYWPVIDIDAVDAKDAGKSAALQLADAIASSVGSGFEPDLYGNCEPRYAEELKPVTYARNANYLSYGMKLVPKWQECGLTAPQMKMLDIWK